MCCRLHYDNCGRESVCVCGNSKFIPCGWCCLLCCLIKTNICYYVCKYVCLLKSLLSTGHIKATASSKLHKCDSHSSVTLSQYDASCAHTFC